MIGCWSDQMVDQHTSILINQSYLLYLLYLLLTKNRTQVLNKAKFVIFSATNLKISNFAGRFQKIKSLLANLCASKNASTNPVYFIKLFSFKKLRKWLSLVMMNQKLKQNFNWLVKLIRNDVKSYAELANYTIF